MSRQWAERNRGRLVSSRNREPGRSRARIPRTAVVALSLLLHRLGRRDLWRPGVVHAAGSAGLA